MHMFKHTYPKHHHQRLLKVPAGARTANLRTEIMDFKLFVSSRILILRCGILRPIGDFQESLSQAIFL